MSASLAAVPTTVCTKPEATSTPKCAFMPKYHWLPFLVWCISGSRAFEILGRRRCIDDRRIDNRAGRHLQSLRRQVPLHLVEQLLAQIMRFEQVTEAHTVVSSGTGS